MSRRRNLTIVSALVVAALATLLLLKVAGSNKRVIQEKVPLAKVFIVTQPVKAGTKGEDMGRFAQVKEVREQDRVPAAINQLAQLQGLIATVDLIPGEQVLSTRFGSTETRAGVTIPPDLSTISILLSPDRVVGGRLEAGKDRVAVLATLSAFRDAQNNLIANDETHIMLHKVAVVNVQFAGSQSQNPGSTAPAAQDTIPSGSMIVTLAVTGPNAERIVFASEKGSLWLAKEPNDASEGGTKLVDRINIWDDVSNSPAGAVTATGVVAGPNAPTTTLPGTATAAAGNAPTTTTTTTTRPVARATATKPGPTTTTNVTRRVGVFTSPKAASSPIPTSVDTTVVRLGH